MLHEKLGDPARLGARGATGFSDRVQALAPIGLSRLQTEFVVIVALHGGYCLQRQYDKFIGLRHGQTTHDFFNRLIASRLATRLQLARHRGYIYHLRAKALYRAIGQVDNRNRRRASSAQIARKLMILDYVLTTQPREWLATEHDKVAAFETQFGVPRVDLPQRRYRSRDRGRAHLFRYFVHKLPIAVDDNGTSVKFVYLAVDQSGDGFRTFLSDHARLFAQLPTWTIVVICPHHVNGLSACREIFARHLANQSSSIIGTGNREDLLWFFRAKLAVERNELKHLSVADLNRFRDLRQGLATGDVEQLFASWKVQGDAALAVDQSWGADPPAAKGHLIEHSLPFSYEQFGSLAGIA